MGLAAALPIDLPGDAGIAGWREIDWRGNGLIVLTLSAGMQIALETGLHCEVSRKWRNQGPAYCGESVKTHNKSQKSHPGYFQSWLSELHQTVDFHSPNFMLSPLCFCPIQQHFIITSMPLPLVTQSPNRQAGEGSRWVTENRWGMKRVKCWGVCILSVFDLCLR